MSFIDLTANDVWSNTDINNKVQALIRSKYSEQDELKAARLSRTTEDSTFVTALDLWVSGCVQEGQYARDDMKLLQEVFVMEDAQRRLNVPVVEPVLNEEGEVINQEDIDKDTAERDAAQLTIDSASSEAKALFDIRNPPIPEEIIPEPLEEELM
jgi:hypothetical protein